MCRTLGDLGYDPQGSDHPCQTHPVDCRAWWGLAETLISPYFPCVDMHPVNARNSETGTISSSLPEAGLVVGGDAVVARGEVSAGIPSFSPSWHISLCGAGRTQRLKQRRCHTNCTGKTKVLRRGMDCRIYNCVDEADG